MKLLHLPFLFCLFFFFFLFFSSFSDCLLFRGIYLTDLTFIDQGNNKYVDSLVNFRKKQLEYDVIIQVLRFQDTPYQFNLVGFFFIFFLLLLF